MEAMVLERLRAPLVRRALAVPEPGPGQVLVRVGACGVCRTDLHVVDGDLAHPKLPLVPGHEVVGRVAAVGAGVEDLRDGERVGVPWLGETCAALGIPLVDPREAMAARLAQGTHVYDDHWTPAGHEVVAGVLAGYLEGYLEDTPRPGRDD